MLISAAALALFSVLLFSGAVTGDFVWDDAYIVPGNNLMGAPGYWREALTHPFFFWYSGDFPITRLFYRPFVALVFSVENSLWGMQVVGYHLVSLALHACCTVFAFFWIRRRLRGGASSEALLAGSIAGALWFAAHPSRVESVAWISGSMDLWMMLWALIAMTLWDRSRGIAGALAAGFALAISLFCKEIGAVVAPLILADTVLRGTFGGHRLLPRAIALLTPFIAALAVRHQFVPLGTEAFSLPLDSAIPVMLGALGGYVRIALWPWPASTQTGYDAAAYAGFPPHLPPILIVAGVITVAGLVIFAAAAWRRPGMRPWLADAMWFFVPLVPVLQAVNYDRGMYVAERHLYLAGIGAAALFGRCVLTAFERGGNTRRAALPVAAVLVAALATGSAIHARHFSSPEALWTYELGRSPDSIYALSGLAEVRVEQGRFAEARELAVREFKLTAAPELRLYQLGTWFIFNASAATRNSDVLPLAHAECEAIEHGTIPPGPTGEMYAALGAESQAAFLKSEQFQIACAVIDTQLANYGAAFSRLREVAQDPRSPGRAIEELMFAAAADGRAGDAAPFVGRVATARSEALARLLVQAREIESSGIAGPARDGKLGSALVVAGGFAAAGPLIQRALNADPNSVPLLADSVTLNSVLHRTKEAVAGLNALRRLDPAHRPDYDALELELKLE